MATFLCLDLETRSTSDLRKVGVFRYAEDPNTDIWCACYAFDDGPVHTWLPGDPPPPAIQEHVAAKGLIRAWNAQFEQTLWNAILTPRYGWAYPRDEQWVCSAAMGARVSLPRSLEDAAMALHLLQQKDIEGWYLMLRMSKPRSRMPLIWWDDPVKLQRLVQYCKQDVETERAVYEALPPAGNATERAIWLLDQEINRRGVRIDRPLVSSALVLVALVTEDLNARMESITQGRVPSITAGAKLIAWLQEQGVDTDTVAKVPLADLLKEGTFPEPVREALRLRQEGAKSSTAKYAMMLSTASKDDRVRGMLLYHAAGTGRWAGRGVQPHNFPRGSIAMSTELIQSILTCDMSRVQTAGPPMEVLSSALRACFIPSRTQAFYAGDFNAIEARVVAWLAGAEEMVSAFRDHRKVYEEMAERIFGIPAPEVAKDSFERFVSKTTVLGCGFQMGWETFQRRMKDQFGIELLDELAERCVTSFRGANPEIVALWRSMNATALRVVRDQCAEEVPVPGTQNRITFSLLDEWLRMRLPSGRFLWYFRPQIGLRAVPWTEPDGTPAKRPAVSFEGVNSFTRKWTRMPLYGGLLTENAVQGIARDFLAEAMLRLEEAGFRIVLTVHDEILAEAPPTHSSEHFCRIMAEIPAWAEGCPVAVEGWNGERYKK